MGYLTMCALSALARRSGSCVLPFLCPRGNLSTWCVERAVVAATLQGVPRARQRDRVGGLLWVVMRPPEPVANERAGLRRAHAASWKPRLRPRWRLDTRWIVDTLARRHAAVDLARPGRATGHPADQVTRKRLERCFRHQLLLSCPYLILIKPLRLDIQCQRGASVKIGWKYLDD